MRSGQRSCPRSPCSLLSFCPSQSLRLALLPTLLGCPARISYWRESLVYSSFFWSQKGDGGSTQTRWAAKLDVARLFKQFGEYSTCPLLK